MRISEILAFSWMVALMAGGCDGSGSGEEVDLLWLDKAVCEGGDEELLPRADQGDWFCADQPDCERAGGLPDHPGCPNTCGCLCFDSRCYLYSCTAIAGCSEPPVFR